MKSITRSLWFSPMLILMSFLLGVIFEQNNTRRPETETSNTKIKIQSSSNKTDAPPPAVKYSNYSTFEVNRDSWEQAIQDAKQMISDRGDEASCFKPMTQATLEIVKKQTRQRSVPLHTPFLNVGFPKCGSTSLFDYFKCAGYKSTHWNINTKDYEGICMRDAVSNGLPPLSTCSKDVEAVMQMDNEWPLGAVSKFSLPFRDECFFPQLSLLKEISEEAPQATFLMNFRPIDDWVKSVSTWNRPKMIDRFQVCNLPNLPRGIPRNLSDTVEVRETMKQFWCSQVLHVRRFVQDHPSHSLIELDLYDSNSSEYIMSELFPRRATNTAGGNKTSTIGCWGKSNSKEKEKK